MPVKTTTFLEALIANGKALGCFQDVVSYPLHKVKDAKFFEDIPGLKLPALIFIFKGRTDRGADLPVQRDSFVSAVIVAEDPKGDAFLQAVDLLDKSDAMLGKEILDGEVWILRGYEANVAESEPRFCVIERAFTTREAIDG